jgi:hypothetical protein
VQDDAQRQNVASNEIAAVTSSASTSETEEDRRRAESAIRALQLRFRLRRLRVIFHERDRSEAAERLQRAWRVKMTRDQHQRQLREGMRDGAARIIQHAFRTSSSFHGGKNSGEEEQHQEKQNDQNEMDRIAYRRAQERLLVERARVAAGNQRNLLSDDDDDDDRRKRNNQNTVLLPQCVVCLGEVEVKFERSGEVDGHLIGFLILFLTKEKRTKRNRKILVSWLDEVLIFEKNQKSQLQFSVFVCCFQVT